MKIRAGFVFTIMLLVTVVSAFASDPQAKEPNLDGAYKFVSVKFPGGEQTEANQKGMIVVHGKHMAFVAATVNRKTWSQDEPEADRTKKVVEAFQGLRATAGSFEIKGDTIILNQVAQAVPSSMGKPSEWKFKVEGNKLMLSPGGNTSVVFTFEKLQ
jgi:hypothetical protein